MKDELGVKIMTEFVALRPKTYSYLMNDGNTVIKKSRRNRKRVIKRIHKFNDYKNCLLNKKIILKPQRLKSELNNVYQNCTN